MTRSEGRRRICGRCVFNSLAGVAWPMWGAKDGWPKPGPCPECSPGPR